MASRKASAARRSHPVRPAHHSLSGWCLAHPVLSFAAVALCLVFLLYRQALSAPFAYDDIDQIQRNPALASWSGLAGYWQQAVPFSGVFRGVAGAFYRPLFWMSLGLDRQLWGLSPAPFHLTNLLLHWVNGLLLFVLLHRLGLRPSLSAGASLLWLVLPINTEVVAWISGRTYSLCFCFLLLSLLAADWHRATGRLAALLVFAAACLAALLAHESGVLSLPLTLAILWMRPSPRAVWLRLGAAALGVMLIYAVLRHATGGSVPGASAIWPVGLALLQYFSWMVLPLNMSVERSTDMPANHFSAAALAALLSIAALLWLLARWRTRAPELTFAVWWILAALLPFCGVVYLYQGTAERYVYIAAAGFALLLVALAGRVPRRLRRIFVTVVAVWTLWGCWRLNARVFDWTDQQTLYATSLQATPRSAVLLYNLGALAEQSGSLEEAAGYYRRAASLQPAYAQPWIGLGNLALRSRDAQQARSLYEKALSIDPGNNSVTLNYGAALQLLGDLPSAERQYRRAIRQAPQHAKPHCDLGALLAQQGQLDAAIDEFNLSIRLDPTYATAYTDLGIVYRRTGRTELADEMFRLASRIKESK